MLTFALFHGWWLLHTLGTHPAWSARLYIDYERDGDSKAVHARRPTGKGFVDDEDGRLEIVLVQDHVCRWFVIDHGTRRRIRGTMSTCDGQPLGRFVGLRQMMHREVGGQRADQ